MATPEHPPEHFDVVIVGAGISGIGTACHLQEKCPQKSFVLLEGRSDFGGTWDLFRYPGIRSDSDMHTLGYSFKPWREAKAIADGPSIKRYLGEAIEENDLGHHIRYQRHVSSASWSSEKALWTIAARRKDTGEAETLTCSFLSICTGYYSYKQGFTPEFEGRNSFQGKVVHPQQWPEDLDTAGQRVVVIGSGATAMTLVPAIAGDVAHVTMLQRSPTYVVSRPDKDWIANTLRKILPERVAYAITRWKNIALQGLFYRKTRTRPQKVKDQLLGMVRKELGEQVVEQHFTPHYDPWDQRLCLIPNSDLFDALKTDKASVVTAEIDRFVENGILLQSGEVLEADIIVTATGLNLVVLGEMDFSLDGAPVNFADTWTYKGLMYSGVPNLMWTFGYINASWTLRADLTAEYLCRLLQHMDATGSTVCTPRLRPSDEDMPQRPWIDDFSAGYMQRSMDQFPMQGDRAPWTNPQDYALEKKVFLEGHLEDGCMAFGSPAREAEQVTEEKVAMTAIVL